MTDLQLRCDAFIRGTNMTVGQFCKYVGLSRESYYAWRNGKFGLKDETLEQIEWLLTDKNAQRYFNEEMKWKPIADCSIEYGISNDVIRRWCTTGAVEAKKINVGRWLVNTESLKKYLNIEPTNSGIYTKKPDQKYVFGKLHDELDVQWHPVTSHDSDHEIFVDDRHEYDIQYWISNDGRIFNAETREILACAPEREPYAVVALKKDGEYVQQYVHRMVAYFFCHRSLFRDVVHHIDGDPLNNHYSNLLWVTPAEHRECHRLMNAKKKREYKKYIKQIRKDNDKWG